MAVSSLDYLFLNNLLYINNCKYHRSHFNTNSNVQYWVCSDKKGRKCPGSAKTRFLESESETNSEEENEKLDPRYDLEKYKEILKSASNCEEHLQFHDVDPHEFKVIKFHVDLERDARVFFS